MARRSGPTSRKVAGSSPHNGAAEGVALAWSREGTLGHHVTPKLWVT